MNITLKDVDKSVKEYIQSLDIGLNGTCVPVKPYKPNILTNKETYPIITFQRYNMKPNKTVQDFNSYIVQYNEEKTRANITDAPTIYDMIIQIDLWSLSMNEISSLETDWLINNSSKVGTLDISYMEGEEKEIYVSPFILQGEMKKMDKLDTTTNSFMIYRRSMNYKIQVPIYPKSIERPVASGVSFNQQ